MRELRHLSVALEADNTLFFAPRIKVTVVDATGEARGMTMAVTPDFLESQFDTWFDYAFRKLKDELKKAYPKVLTIEEIQDINNGNNR